MQRIMVMALGLMMLMGCGKGAKLDAKIDKYLSKPNLSIDQILDHKGMGMRGMKDMSFLSAAAKVNADLLHQKMRDLMKQKREICGLPDLISAEDRTKIAAIRDNASLDQAAKKDQIKEILAKFKPAKKAHREAMKKCRDDKADQLKPLKEKLMVLKTACLLSMKGKDKGEHGKRGGKWKHMDLTEAQKTELNAKLESSACTEALK